MHEGAIARSILESSAETMKTSGLTKVEEVSVVVGRIHHVVGEVLQTCFNVMKTDFPGLMEAALLISEREVLVNCRDCGADTQIEDLPLFVCGDCGSMAVSVVSGEELLIETLRGEGDSNG